MKRWFAVVAAFITTLSCYVTSAHAAPELAAQVAARLAHPAVLRGEFEQQRQVQGFAKPLVSRGSFVVARGQGVLWDTRAPFASQLVLNRTQIRASQDGVAAFRLDASTEPAVRVINGVLFGLLDGDLQALAAHFRVDGQADAKGWQIRLEPKDAAIARLMSRIELDGDQYVRRIRILDASGDRSSLVLSAQREDAALQPEEAKRLEQ